MPAKDFKSVGVDDVTIQHSVRLALNDYTPLLPIVNNVGSNYGSSAFATDVHIT